MKAVQYRVFGSTGEMVSILGMGAMRLPIINNDPSVIDVSQAISLLRYGIDSGINYIDTAFTYHKQESEKIVGLALKGSYRKKVKIATKLPVWYMEKATDFERIFSEQLRRLDTDYIDFYLLHGLNREKWTKALQLDVLNSISQKKKAGYIKHIGFSFHGDFDLFQEIIHSYKEWEFCQLLLNYVVNNRDLGIDELNIAAQNKLGISIMEPLLGGRLANLPLHIMKYYPLNIEPVEAALAWLWNKREVNVVLSGMSNLEQLKANIEFATHYSSQILSEGDLSQLESVAKLFRQSSLVNCSGCGYCLPCTANIDIPNIFEIYNMSAYDLNAKYQYKNLTDNAAACVRCNACVKRCPQSINIPDILDDIHSSLGKIKH